MFVTSELLRNDWKQKNANIGLASIFKSIPNEVFVGALALLLTFPLSGGLVRVQQLQSSLTAVEKKETYQAWVEPAKFVSEFCPNVGHECEVNASVYYRVSWAVFGLQTILENPMGLGDVKKPLQEALQKKYPMVYGSSLPDDFHSELISFGVRFGIVILLVVFAIGMWMYARLFFKSRDSDSSCASLASGFLVIIFIRLAGDSIGMGGAAVALFLLLLLSIVSIKFEGISRGASGR